MLFTRKGLLFATTTATPPLYPPSKNQVDFTEKLVS